MLQELIELEATERIGAGKYERTEGRTTERNGGRPRLFSTRAGDVQLRIPKLRKGSFFPSILEPRRRIDRALYAVVIQAYVHGVSTRSVDDLVEAMGVDSGISKSEVSRIAPVWMIVGRSALAPGAHRDQYARRNPVSCGDAEVSCTTAIKSRGLSGVRLVISDQHAGLVKALRRCFQGAGRQRCRVHFARNLLAHVPKTHMDMVAAMFRTIVAQPDAAAVGKAWDQVRDQLAKSFPKIGPMMDDAKAEVLAFTVFPKAHWQKIWSTNPLERINKEIKRRSRVVGIFPNHAAVIRLVGAILADMHDEWQAGDRRYLSDQSMDLLYPERNNQPIAAIGGGE